VIEHGGETTPTTKDPASSDEDGIVAPLSEADESPVAMDVDTASSEPEPKAESIDPAVKRLDEAMAALKQTDAIMEPGKLVLFGSPVVDYRGR
jgi:hypothetical protein